MSNQEKGSKKPVSPPPLRRKVVGPSSRISVPELPDPSPDQTPGRMERRDNLSVIDKLGFNISYCLSSRSKNVDYLICSTISRNEIMVTAERSSYHNCPGVICLNLEDVEVADFPATWLTHIERNTETGSVSIYRNQICVCIKDEIGDLEFSTYRISGDLQSKLDFKILPLIEFEEIASYSDMKSMDDFIGFLRILNEYSSKLSGFALIDSITALDNNLERLSLIQANLSDLSANLKRFVLLNSQEKKDLSDHILSEIGSQQFFDRMRFDGDAGGIKAKLDQHNLALNAILGLTQSHISSKPALDLYSSLIAREYAELFVLSQKTLESAESLKFRSADSWFPHEKLKEFRALFDSGSEFGPSEALRALNRDTKEASLRPSDERMSINDNDLLREALHQ